MRHNETPDRADGSGLTTEDLAGFRDREPGVEADPGRAAPVDAGEAPVYPGEATRSVDERTAREGAEEIPGATRDGSPDPAPDEAPVAASTEGTAVGAPVATADEEAPELLSARDVDAYRSRWQRIQNDFVDDPREAVHAADGLVADVMRALAETFAEHKRGLEGQWNQGEAVDTESLRMALRQYRSFFHRLLTK
ncbi:hypothetical protein [Streptomyces sp. NPDC053755]|uniref:hypothetical protein n=1 Tax=Streptomyces sp. NPDC053755 TaxID=3155815 RepID=UPI00341F3A5C